MIMGLFLKNIVINIISNLKGNFNFHNFFETNSFKDQIKIPHGPKILNLQAVWYHDG